MPSRIRLRENGLAAHLYLEREPEEAARPLAMVCPGLPYEPTQEAVTPSLVDAGFDVLQLQYIGTYDSDGRFSPEAARDTVPAMLERLTTGSVVNRKDGQQVNVARAPSLLFGHSFGSWVALRALERVTVGYCVVAAPSFAYGSDARQVGVAVNTSGQAGYLAAALPLTFRLADEDEWRRFFDDADGTRWRPGAVDSSVQLIAMVGAQDESYDVTRLRNFVDEQRADHAGLRELIVVDDADHGLEAFSVSDEWSAMLEELAGVGRE